MAASTSNNDKPTNMAGPEDTTVITAMMHMISMKEELLLLSRNAAPIVPWVTEVAMYDTAHKQLSKGIGAIVRTINVPPKFFAQICRRTQEGTSGNYMPMAWVALERIGRILTALADLIRDTDDGLLNVAGYKAIFSGRSAQRLASFEKLVRDNSITRLPSVKLTRELKPEHLLELLAMGPSEAIL